MKAIERMAIDSLDNGVSLGPICDELTIHRFRCRGGRSGPRVGGDGRVHVIANLSRGQRIETTGGGGTAVRVIETGDVSIDHPNALSRYINSGAPDIAQLSLDAPATSSRKGRRGTRIEVAALCESRES